MILEFLPPLHYHHHVLCIRMTIPRSKYFDIDVHLKKSHVVDTSSFRVPGLATPHGDKFHPWRDW